MDMILYKIKSDRDILWRTKSMKFYSEKLSPRRLSLQWRLTLLISGLVITACALMYFFISRSAVTGLEGISDYVVLVTPDNSSPISINVDPKILIRSDGKRHGHKVSQCMHPTSGRRTRHFCHKKETFFFKNQ